MKKSEQIVRFGEATGMGVTASRLFLIGKSPEFVERIILARETQSSPQLHDPIEDDGRMTGIIAEANREVEVLLKETPKQRGLCHLIWKHKKRILKERGISWYSPAEMNPGIIFD